MLFRCTRQHIRSFLQLAGCLTPVFGTFEFRLHSKPIFLCLIAFKVLNINHISIAVVAFFYAGVDQPNRMSTEETLLQPCTLYSQLLLTYSQKCVFFPSLTVVLLTFSLHYFLTFPCSLSLSTKDNIDMSLHLQFWELKDWIMDHNELSLPL